MWAYLSEPASQRWALALVHFLWQGTTLAGLLVVLLRWRRDWSAQQRYVASLAALGLMGVCPFVTFSILAADIAADGSGPARLLVDRLPDEPLETSVDLLGGPDSHEFGYASATQPYLLMLWLIGVAAFSIRLAGCYAGTLWLRGEQIPLPATIALQVAGIGRCLHIRAARVYASSRVGEALAVGLLRPIVLVPLSWLSELPADVLEAVIAHELAHIRRFDLWATLAQRLIEALLFFHPAVWWVSRRVSLERELCCDELAVMATGRPVSYARALETVGRRAALNTRLALTASFDGGTQMYLLNRVQHVLGRSAQRDSGMAGPAGVLILSLSLGGWLLASGTAISPALAQDEKQAGTGDELKKAKAAKKAAVAELKARKDRAEKPKSEQLDKGAANDLQEKLLQVRREKLKAAIAEQQDAEVVKRKLDEAAAAKHKAGLEKLGEAVKQKLADELTAKHKAAAEQKLNEADKQKLGEAVKQKLADVVEAKQKAAVEQKLNDADRQKLAEAIAAKLKAAEEQKHYATAKQKLAEDKKYKPAAEEKQNLFDTGAKPPTAEAKKTLIRKQAAAEKDPLQSQSKREADLYQLIEELRKEVSQLRQEVEKMRGAQKEGTKTGAADATLLRQYYRLKSDAGKGESDYKLKEAPDKKVPYKKEAEPDKQSANGQSTGSSDVFTFYLGLMR